MSFWSQAARASLRRGGEIAREKGLLPPKPNLGRTEVQRGAGVGGSGSPPRRRAPDESAAEALGQPESGSGGEGGDPRLGYELAQEAFRSKRRVKATLSLDRGPVEGIVISAHGRGCEIETEFGRVFTAWAELDGFEILPAPTPTEAAEVERVKLTPAEAERVLAEKDREIERLREDRDLHERACESEERRRREAEEDAQKAERERDDAQSAALRCAEQERRAEEAEQRASKLEGLAQEVAEECEAMAAGEQPDSRAPVYRAVADRLRQRLQAQHSPEKGGGEEGVCPECDHDIRPGASHARTCSRNPLTRGETVEAHYGTGRKTAPVPAPKCDGTGWITREGPAPEGFSIGPPESERCPGCEECDARHRVEIEFDGFSPSVRLVHPESGCPRGEEGEDCFLTDWLENEGVELLRGKLTLPVRWEAPEDRDHPLFHVLALDCQPTDTPSQPDGLAVPDAAVEAAKQAFERLPDGTQFRERLTQLPEYAGDEVVPPSELAREMLEAAAPYLTPPVSGLSDEDRERLLTAADRITGGDPEEIDAAFLRSLADKTPEPKCDQHGVPDCEDCYVEALSPEPEEGESDE